MKKHSAEPIKNKSDIKKIENYLRNENKRNYALNLWSYKKNTKINPGIAEKKSF